MRTPRYRAEPDAETGFWLVRDRARNETVTRAYAPDGARVTVPEDAERDEAARAAAELNGAP